MCALRSVLACLVLDFEHFKIIQALLHKCSIILVLIFFGAEAIEFTKEAEKLPMPATPSPRYLEFGVVLNLSQYHS
jgi:hypothetical protein